MYGTSAAHLKQLATDKKLTTQILKNGPATIYNQLTKFWKKLGVKHLSMIRKSHLASGGSHSKINCIFFQAKIGNRSKITKRSILVNIAALYDPLGWLSPIIIKAKLQRLAPNHHSVQQSVSSLFSESRTLH